MLRNPACAGHAVFGKTQAVHEPARLAGRTVPRHVRVQDRPRDERTHIPVPALADEETSGRVQQRPAASKRFASRNSKVPHIAHWLPLGLAHVTAAPGISHLGQHHPRSSYTRGMSALREELHHLVDQLPEDRLAPVLQLIRGDGRKTRAVATLEAVRARMSGVTGVDEELSRLRDGDRG
jgi:hypothetical protein